MTGVPSSITRSKATHLRSLVDELGYAAYAEGLQPDSTAARDRRRHASDALHAELDKLTRKRP